MSRTYHHGERQRNKLFLVVNYQLRHQLYYEAPPKSKRFSEEANYFRTPNWWVHEYSEVSHRAHTRNLLAKVRTGDDDVVLPLVRKPHHYYW